MNKYIICTFVHLISGNGYPCGLQSTVPLPPVGIFKCSVERVMLLISSGDGVLIEITVKTVISGPTSYIGGA